jgi:hypothetical protein
LSPVENESDRRKTPFDRCCQHGTAPAHHSVGAVQKGGTVQDVAGDGRPVVTAENASTMLLGQTVAEMIESVAEEKDDEKSE